MQETIPANIDEFLTWLCVFCIIPVQTNGIGVRFPRVASIQPTPLRGFFPKLCYLLVRSQQVERKKTNVAPAIKLLWWFSIRINEITSGPMFSEKKCHFPNHVHEVVAGAAVAFALALALVFAGCVC